MMEPAIIQLALRDDKYVVGICRDARPGDEAAHAQSHADCFWCT
jgi:hypothetical protein